MNELQLTDGQQLLDRLRPAGVSTWDDVLLYLPRSYLDLTTPVSLHLARPNGDLVGPDQLFSLILTDRPAAHASPTPRLVAYASDGTHSVRLIAYLERRRAAAWQELEPGATVHLLGQLQSWAGRLQITSPTLVPPQYVGRVIPQYPVRHASVPSRHILAATQHILESNFDSVLALVAQRTGKPAAELGTLLREVHAPTSLLSGTSALEGATDALRA